MKRDVPFFPACLSPVPNRASDINAFKAAYDRLNTGIGFVRIHRLRGSLGWERERFDRVFTDLLEKYKVEAHRGDLSRMTAQEIRDSWTDEMGTYTTCTWW